MDGVADAACRAAAELPLPEGIGAERDEASACDPPAEAQARAVDPRTPSFESDASPASADVQVVPGALLRQVPQAIDRIARAVAQFCADPAVDNGEGGWDVTLRLPPALLPGTTLQLKLSLYWLQLRFTTPDRATHSLLSTHQSALAERLAGAVTGAREILIDIE